MLRILTFTDVVRLTWEMIKDNLWYLHITESFCSSHPWVCIRIQCHYSQVSNSRLIQFLHVTAFENYLSIFVLMLAMKRAECIMSHLKDLYERLEVLWSVCVGHVLHVAGWESHRKTAKLPKSHKWAEESEINFKFGFSNPDDSWYQWVKYESLLWKQTSVCVLFF